ncbi:MAG: PrgI family protein [Eubacterium sp.]|nr:PrgI family protein [Eubacterium sp.]
MIEIQVPKDITTYKTKSIGPLTTRQLVILTVVVALDIVLYTAVLKDRNLSTETLIYLIAFIDTPISAFMFEVYGLPMEKFIAQFFLCNVLTPVRRKYVGTLQKEVDPPITEKRLKLIEKKRKKMIREAKKNEDFMAYD